jgi:predicted  nucleic acid-binding Zn-ribbon protein
MPERSQLLLDLQAFDLEIGRLTRQVQQIDTQLGDQMKVRAGEHAIKQADQSLLARERAQREAEMELATIEARIKDHEQKLYSGGRNPRELEALQRDIEHDRQRRAEAENQALAAMDATDKARTEAERIKKAVARVLGESSTDHKRLAGEREQIQRQLTAKQSQRGEIAARLSPQSLALYDRLRARMPNGIAVAPVAQNRCEGCGTTIPSAEIQHARNSEALSQCSACGRIMHVPLG